MNEERLALRKVEAGALLGYEDLLANFTMYQLAAGFDRSILPARQSLVRTIIPASDSTLFFHIKRLVIPEKIAAEILIEGMVVDGVPQVGLKGVPAVLFTENSENGLKFTPCGLGRPLSLMVRNLSERDLVFTAGLVGFGYFNDNEPKDWTAAMTLRRMLGEHLARS